MTLSNIYKHCRSLTFRGILLLLPTSTKPYVSFQFPSRNFTSDDLESLDQGHGKICKFENPQNPNFLKATPKRFTQIPNTSQVLATYFKTLTLTLYSRSQEPLMFKTGIFKYDMFPSCWVKMTYYAYRPVCPKSKSLWKIKKNKVKVMINPNYSWPLAVYV